MLYQYDGAGNICQVSAKFYPSPLGLVKIMQMGGGQLIIETPDLFGPLQTKMQEEILPGILKGLGLPVQTPKKEKRSDNHERSTRK